MDNRTVALRAITTGSKSCRLETRVVGSDSNPYLASAACLAAGLYGIKNKLDLKQAPTKGSGYQDKQHGVLSKTLGEAVEKMQQSDIAETLFGKAFTQHFLQTREWEWRQSLRPVTDWELKRYLEII